MRRIFFLFLLFLVNQACFGPRVAQYDPVIYGGTSAGVSAAIQASGMGKR